MRPSRPIAPPLLTCLCVVSLLRAQADRERDPARTFFSRGAVVEVAIELQPADRQRLRDRPREYVPATLRLDGDKRGWSGVGVKLKGAAGSFREVDERPGFTVNLGKFGGEARLHGLKRFHLNNGRQDASRMCEWVGHEVFAAAGYPAPRVGHARVWLDGEDLGLYVLREGYDKQFLQRVFGHLDGSLYDGGFCKDIDRDLEKDAGSGPDDLSDLAQLRAACADVGDAEDRVRRLRAAVDVDRFLDFMAIEAMLGHWDGYSQNRNNFRLWIAADPAATCFLPHGMDQLYGDADASVLAYPSAIVAKAVQQQPAWRARYRARLKALLPRFKPGPLVSKIKARAAKVKRAMKSLDDDAVREFEGAVRDLTARVAARYRHLQKEVRRPDPKPLAFRGDRPVRLKSWRAAGETDHVALKKRSFGGTPALFVAVTSPGESERRGAYRATVLLGRGRYRFAAEARCRGVRGVGDARGARVMVGDAASEVAAGEQGWTELSCTFEVEDVQQSVELRMELRAADGEAWFRASSPQLQKLPE
ncbi:MAG: CotH kinase family protein [Planctomycetota bacterium]